VEVFYRQHSVSPIAITLHLCDELQRSSQVVINAYSAEGYERIAPQKIQVINRRHFAQGIGF